MALADAAAALLLHLHSSSQHGQLHPILADGLMHRAVVQQATGMVAVQVDADLADALSVLRARAFASSRPITDIARHVVARHLRFTP
jgi:AmiR/NasT family two-component response regulator